MTLYPFVKNLMKSFLHLMSKDLDFFFKFKDL